MHLLVLGGPEDEAHELGDQELAVLLLVGGGSAVAGRFRLGAARHLGQNRFDTRKQHFVLVLMGCLEGLEQTLDYLDGIQLHTRRQARGDLLLALLSYLLDVYRKKVENSYLEIDNLLIL